MTRAPASDWNGLVVVGPMLAFASLYAARRGMRLLGALGALATFGLVVQAWRGVGLAPGTLYLAQHVGIHLLLAFVFGSTLQSGREPLITALARRVHERITAPMVAYSRKVTVAWTLYFVAMAADLDRPLRVRTLRGLGRVRQPADAVGDGARSSSASSRCATVSIPSSSAPLWPRRCAPTRSASTAPARRATVPP